MSSNFFSVNALVAQAIDKGVDLYLEERRQKFNSEIPEEYRAEAMDLIHFTRIMEFSTSFFCAHTVMDALAFIAEGRNYGRTQEECHHFSQIVSYHRLGLISVTQFHALGQPIKVIYNITERGIWLMAGLRMGSFEEEGDPIGRAKFVIPFKDFLPKSREKFKF